MSVKEEKSLLELSIEYLKKQEEPQDINVIIKEVMNMKGLKANEIKEKAPQFVMDFMLSGNFVYCGEDKWDLKYRQPTSVLDKDGGDYEQFYSDDDDEVKNNELKDDTYEEYEDASSQEYDEDEDEDEEENKNDDLDLTNDFEEFVGSAEDLEELDEDEEDEE